MGFDFWAIDLRMHLVDFVDETLSKLDPIFPKEKCSVKHLTGDSQKLTKKLFHLRQQKSRSCPKT